VRVFFGPGNRLIGFALQGSFFPPDFTGITNPPAYTYQPVAHWTGVYGSDLLGAGQRGVFSLVSRQPPGMVHYQYQFADLSDNLPTTLSGTVVGPQLASVPEPSGGLLLGLGGLALAAARWFRRPRTGARPPIRRWLQRGTTEVNS
jgi:hypothetical protein